MGLVTLLYLLKRVLNPSYSKIWASESHGAYLFQEVSLVTYELLSREWRKRSECQAGQGRPFWKLNSWVCSVYCIIQGCLEIRFMAFLANVKIASKADHLTPPGGLAGDDPASTQSPSARSSWLLLCRMQ